METEKQDVRRIDCGAAIGRSPNSAGQTQTPVKDSFRPHKLEWDDQKVSRFWDHMASSVVGKEEYFSRQVGQGVTNFLAAICPDALAGKVLDFGCGPGYLLEPMSKVSGEIWGADSSLDSLRAASERLRDQPNWRGELVAEAGKVPQPNGHFNLITCVETIEHVIPQHLESMLNELHRLLRRYDGLLLITTPFDERLEMSEVFCADCGAIFHRWQHVRKFTVGTLSSLVEQHGFSTQLCTNLNFCDFQAGDFPTAGLPVISHQVTSRLGKGPHLIWLGRAV